MRNAPAIALVLLASCLAGCTSVDKTSLFNDIGTPDVIPIEGHSGGQVYAAVVKITEKYFDTGAENEGSGVVYTGFLKNAYNQKYPEVAETYLRKCVADVTALSATQVELRLQVAAFKIKESSILPTGFRDSALHEAIKQQILDELSVE
jgi:hypothetical protein